MSQAQPQPPANAYTAYAPAAPMPTPRPADLTPPQANPYGSLQRPALQNTGSPEAALALSRQPQSPMYVPPPQAQPQKAAQPAQNSSLSSTMADLVKRGVVSMEQALSALAGS